MRNLEQTGMMSRMLLAAILLLLSGVSYAEQNTLVYDRYSLQVSAESEVENDLMVVNLMIEDEDSNSAALADRINQEMLWALLQTEKHPRIKSSTKDYNTYPKYEKNRIIGWRSSQVLQLESTDFESIKKAVAELQERLIVRSMQFLSRPETRKDAENNLIDEALTSFRERSTLIQKSMQAETYRIIQLSVNTNDFGSPMYRVESMNMDARSVSKSVAAPAIDAGTSKIRVSVSGEIQLQ